jgi:hypothetical protein
LTEGLSDTQECSDGNKDFFHGFWISPLKTNENGYYFDKKR